MKTLTTYRSFHNFDAAAVAPFRFMLCSKYTYICIFMSSSCRLAGWQKFLALWFLRAQCFSCLVCGIYCLSRALASFCKSSNRKSACRGTNLFWRIEDTCSRETAKLSGKFTLKYVCNAIIRGAYMCSSSLHRKTSAQQFNSWRIATFREFVRAQRKYVANFSKMCSGKVYCIYALPFLCCMLLLPQDRSDSKDH